MVLKFVQKLFPRGVLDDRVKKRGAQIFRRRVGDRKAKDLGYISLCRNPGIKEEDLGFFKV